MNQNLKKIGNFFAGLFKKEKRNSSSSEFSIDDLNKLPDPAKYFSQTFAIEEVNNDQELAITLKNIHYEIGKIGDNFRQLGVNDGQFGVHESTMKSIVGNVAQSTQAYIETIFLGQHDAMKIDLEAKQSIADKADDDFETSRLNLNELNESKKWKPTRFSSFSCTIYLITGIGLILADLILSLQITKNGFALEQNHEKWGMAAGVALATIYVKYFFDKYLLPPLERSVSAFKSINLPGVENIKLELNQVKIVWLLRFLLNVGILLFFLMTIYNIGEFRFEYLESENKYSDFPIEITRTTKKAFLRISFLFPIIGGVCSAIGIRIFENILFYRNTKKQFKEKKQEMDKAQRELNLSAKKLKNYNNYVSWCKLDGPFIANTAKFFYACYVHGYEFGYQKRNSGIDVFDRAKELRKYHAARQARNKLVALLNEYKPELNTAI